MPIYLKSHSLCGKLAVNLQGEWEGSGRGGGVDMDFKRSNQYVIALFDIYIHPQEDVQNVFHGGSVIFKRASPMNNSNVTINPMCNILIK